MRNYPLIPLLIFDPKEPSPCLLDWTAQSLGQRLVIGW